MVAPDKKRMTIMNIRILAASAVLLSILSPVANASPVRAKMNSATECVGATAYGTAKDCVSLKDFNNSQTVVKALPSDVENLNAGTNGKFETPRSAYTIIYKTDPNAYLPNGKYVGAY
jgi:hypothetical protein